jgi:hypothetical protein
MRRFERKHCNVIAARYSGGSLRYLLESNPRLLLLAAQDKIITFPIKCGCDHHHALSLIVLTHFPSLAVALSIAS